MMEASNRALPAQARADLRLASRPGHGRARWLECPACGSHELRPPTPDEVRPEPAPDLVCVACEVVFRSTPGGGLAPVR